MKRSHPWLLGLSLTLLAGLSRADVWVFEPSAGIDQRFDDNYTILPDSPGRVSATRAVGSLELSRESQTTAFKGLARVDGLLTLGDSGFGTEDENVNSNAVLFLDAKRTLARSSYGLGLNVKFDTPNRDISADITDVSVTAADTGASGAQSENVARARVILSPSYSYNLSRRASVETELKYTVVRHALPSAAESLRKREEALAAATPAGEPPPVLAPDAVFTVGDELDDFEEASIDVGYRYKVSPISTFSLFASFSQFNSETEADPAVKFAFEDKIPDDEQRRILRNPKRNSSSQTTKLRVGWDHALSQTIDLGFQVGLYRTEIDNSDLFRANDPSDLLPDTIENKLASLKGSDQGYLSSISLSRKTDISFYSIRFGIDVLPSDTGSEVESLDAVGSYDRELGPLLDFSFRLRAFEPDARAAKPSDKFSRRFISVEPKLVWRFNRSWTAAASYRYRRQKSRADDRSGESNAVLFSLKYTPPSAIRDLIKGQ